MECDKFDTRIINETMEQWSRIFLEKLILAQLSKTFEPEGQLRCLQKPANGQHYGTMNAIHSLKPYHFDVYFKC
jgi:hypothetical protein